MTREQITAEINKLNASQRTSLRKAVGTGTIEFLTVKQRGSYTQVKAQMYGVKYFLMIGPRGKVMDRHVY